MRIHTDKQASVIGAIFAATRKLPGVHASVVPHGSRSRKGAVELRLEGNGGHRNSGTNGADTYEQAATWDEWGVVLAHIFEVDPDAIMGSAKRPTYADARHFHIVTAERFGDLELPEDTHKRHNWEFTEPFERKCTKCSAYVDYEMGDVYVTFWEAA